MKNENKQAMPMAYAETDYPVDGLSKLEYASIHIAAGIAASEPGLFPDHVARMSVSIAKQIFKQLEDNSTTSASGSEL